MEKLVIMLREPNMHVFLIDINGCGDQTAGGLFEIFRRVFRLLFGILLVFRESLRKCHRERTCGVSVAWKEKYGLARW